jgi:hypothetical protein
MSRAKSKGAAAEGSSKARERLQVLVRIRLCPTARRITAESQSQHGQAPLCIGRCRSPDQWIRHALIFLFVPFCRLSATSPLVKTPLCPDTAIVVGFSGSLASCPLSMGTLCACRAAQSTTQTPQYSPRGFVY